MSSVRGWIVGLAVLGLVLAACEGTPEPPGGEQGAPPPTAREADVEVATTEGGTAVLGFPQEPLTLNPTVEDGNVLATTQVALATVLPLWVLTPDWEYEPTALLDRAEVDDEGDRFSVTYHLAEDAGWSDGTPVTAADVLFTLETCLDPRWAITARDACTRVDMSATEARLDPDGKVIEVVFTEPYAPWQTLFSTADGIILPSHLLDGEDWNNAWDDEIPIASGPFRFESWERGEQLTLVRNESYAGPPAHLDRLVLTFAPERALVQQLRDGEIHLLEPQPRLELVRELEAIEGVDLQATDGPIWEHLSFQQDRPPLDDAGVRRAISQAVDREALVEQLVAPVHPAAAPLESLVFVRGQPAYEEHLADLFDPDAAVAAFEDRGCVRADDGIFVCQGERLSFEYTTTDGDERRALAFELLVDQLAEAGIELTPRFADAAAVFSDEVLRAGMWELISFAWVAGADPAVDVELWSCAGDRNHTGHCDELASRLLRDSLRETDQDERRQTINRVGRRLAEDLPALPLYQLPSILVVDGDAITGPEVNPTLWGPVWNVGDWRAVAG